MPKRAGKPTSAKARAAKRDSGRKRAPSKKSDALPITLTTLHDGRIETYEIGGKYLHQIALQWYYRVRYRNRWSDSVDARQSLLKRALEQLHALNIDKSALAAITKAGIVEVHVPFVDDEVGWEGRILPWEFLLRAATEMPELTVVRHLKMQASAGGEESRTRLPGAPTKLLFVQSSPGAPFENFSFDIEQCLVQGSLRLKNTIPLIDPTAKELEQTIQQEKPSVIHLAGFDTHQGDDIIDRYNNMVSATREVKRVKEQGKENWDGMYLAGEEANQVEGVTAERLGTILNPPKAGGALVTFNFYDSAARVAAMAVRSGSAAAIGFQDVVDDAVAERFFASFFQHWRASEWNVLRAFEQATKGVALANERASGVVLWSASPLLNETYAAQADPTRKAKPPQELKIDGIDRSVFKVVVEPNEDVNYSLLHNGQGLFERFRFEKYEPQYVHGIRVSVELHMGAERFPYEATFDLDADDPILDIAQHVNLPLTSELARSLREDLLTSLRVCVYHKDQRLYTDTHRVKLLAVNQWTFDRREGGRWLASFVLPGDPAIARIVDSAQKYLMALRDDPGAGFDGYQSTDETNPDQQDEGVDMQVRALWSAMSFDAGLSYINPPPVFTEGSQRLRTPSTIVNGRRGTCIDLALMFAACLEFVEIHPVIFLLTDHAFPGYWRNERSYEEFLEVTKVGDVVALESGVDASYTAQRRLRFEEIRQWVRDGQLVPLETVWLTSHRGFGDAVQAGIDNLRTSANFESLVNIRKLRDERVTPLPISGEIK